jgi:hypothetical protein
MARTKPKPFRATNATSNQAGYVGRFAIGDLILLYSTDGAAVPALTLKYNNFYLITVTPELYERMKESSLDVDASSLNYNNLFLGNIGSGNYYWVLLRNARLVDTSRQSGSGGIPFCAPVDATEGDGLTIAHKSASTNLSSFPNNWTFISTPTTGQQAYFHQRTGGTAGSYTPPDFVLATQTGSWAVTCFYFESARTFEPISYEGPYIVESRMLSPSTTDRTTAVLPSQTEVGDLVLNLHASANGTSIPTTPTNWTSISNGTAIAPYYDLYYKYITDVDTDDQFTTYSSSDLMYTGLLRNVSSSNFIVGTADINATSGSVVTQPNILSLQNIAPYQLGFFAGIQKIEVPIDKSIVMSSTNEWELDNSIPAYNAFTASERISLAISTFDALEEQVLPPSQMAFSETIETSGTALTTTYPNVSISFLVKNNQQ